MAKKEPVALVEAHRGPRETYGTIPRHICNADFCLEARYSQNRATMGVAGASATLAQQILEHRQELEKPSKV